MKITQITLILIFAFISGSLAKEYIKDFDFNDADFIQSKYDVKYFINDGYKIVQQETSGTTTGYVLKKGDEYVNAIYAALKAKYEKEPFVYVLPKGLAPATQHVRGSNYCHIGVIADRKPGRVMVFSTLDNLTKGSSGQAVQNANLMLGLPETMGLQMVPLFP